MAQGPGILQSWTVGVWVHGRLAMVYFAVMMSLSSGCHSRPGRRYRSTVPPFEPRTQYKFSVATVREGAGGEGNKSPVFSTITETESPPSRTTSGPTTMESTPSSWTPTDTAPVMNLTGQPSNTPPPSFIVPVVISVIVVVIVVAVTLCLYFLRRRKGRRRPAKMQPGGGRLRKYETRITPENDIERAGHDRPISYIEVGIRLPSPSYEDIGVPSWARRWGIPWEEMMVGKKVLGAGIFGEVCEGAVMVQGELTQAAVKKLKVNASATDQQNFMKEFQTLTKIGRHPNVVGILGACQREDILYVALEFMHKGDLRTYLRNARSLEDNDRSTLSSKKLIQIALDVAKGMQHLAALGVIHRDLAARNILLDRQLVAKVSELGLSRGEDIYVQRSTIRVPTRWLPLESLMFKTYTSKSDVWSFGVLLWEIATLGATPYENIQTKNLLSKLQGGYRLPKPRNSDEEIYNLMLQCWQADPGNRPHFNQLVTRLTTMADSPNGHTYMRLLPRAHSYMYLIIRPELDDN